MRKPLTLAALLLLGAAGSLLAHDMFLKLTRYVLPENSTLTIPLLNGTFALSENAIDRNRIADISLVSPAGRIRLDTTVVSARSDSTFFAARTGAAGTYGFGVSTRPNVLTLSGKDFTAYLEEEALHELIAERRREGISGDSATERYSKHVKAVFQVGEVRSAGYAAVLGYPAELVPLENPYALRPGATLRLRALVKGEPASGLTVLAGGRDPRGRRLPVQTLRTDSSGVVALRLLSAGVYYAKFIAIGKQTDIQYESIWATITFEIR
jgi:uncharacterized GH25 family protein